MAGSVNKVILIGNLGRDPEVRRTQSGAPIVNMRIATTETWRDKQSGERKERTEWHTVVIFNEGLCRVAEQYLKKGMKVYIEGQLQTRKWQDQSGQDRYSTEVVLQNFRGELQMLDPRGAPSGGGMGEPSDDYSDYGSGGGFQGDRGGGDFGRPARQQERRPSGGGGGRDRGPANDMDDDIPFAHVDVEGRMRRQIGKTVV